MSQGTSSSSSSSKKSNGEKEPQTQQQQPPKKIVRFDPRIQVIPSDLPISREDSPRPIPSVRRRPAIKRQTAFDRLMLMRALREMVNIAEKRLRMHYSYLKEKDLDEAFLINERVLRKRAKRRALEDAGEAGLTLRKSKVRKVDEIQSCCGRGPGARKEKKIIGCCPVSIGKGKSKA